MQAFVRWIIVLVAVFAATPAVAGKIGFLNTEQAIKYVQEGKRQFEALNAWADQKSDEVEALQKRVNELTDQYNTQRSIASADALGRIERDLLKAQRDLEDLGRSVQRDYEEKQRELLADVAYRVRTVASDFAKANDFDVVFTLDSQPLVYINDAVIITDGVIRLYDERFPID